MLCRRVPRCRALIAACLLLSAGCCEASSFPLAEEADGSAGSLPDAELIRPANYASSSGDMHDRRQPRHRQINQVHDPPTMQPQQQQSLPVQDVNAEPGMFSAQLVEPTVPEATPALPVPDVPDIPVAALPSTEPPTEAGGDASHLHGAHTASKADLDMLFGQIYADLQPFQETGITLEMVEQVYCMFNTQSFRLQVIGGQMYIGGETLPFAQIQDRFKIMMSHVWSRYKHRLPDIDIMIQFDDWMIPNLTGKHPHGQCALQGPVVTPSKMANENHGLLAPDSSWMDPPGWDVNRELLLNAAALQPWHNRTSKLVFRGAPNGMRQWMLGPELSSLRNDDLDVALKSWWKNEDAQDTLSVAEECSFKYLLYMPGNTWANRMKYLMACGSTVIMPRDRYVAFWWHLLQDQKNVYIIDPLAGGNSAGPYLRSVVEELRAHDAEAEAMGANALRIVRDILHPDNIYEYWFRLLTEYAKLQRFTPTRHPDTIPLAESIMRVAQRKVIHFDNRTCEICVRPIKEHVWHSHHMAGVGRV